MGNHQASLISNITTHLQDDNESYKGKSNYTNYTTNYTKLYFLALLQFLGMYCMSASMITLKKHFILAAALVLTGNQHNQVTKYTICHV